MSPAPAGLWEFLAWGACVAARLGPVAFLCPLLGGPLAPATVRLGVTLALTTFVLGVTRAPAAGALTQPGTFIAALVTEAVLGLCLGLAAAAPFDAARVGGRIIDLVRGSSAEAMLPQAGTREAATGDLLYQLVVALAASGSAAFAVVAVLVRGFAALPVGEAPFADAQLESAVRTAGAVLAMGLGLAAPVAALCLLVDGAVALAARVAPQLGLQEQVAGVRLTVGAFAVWLGAGEVAQRLLAACASSSDKLASLAEEVSR